MLRILILALISTPAISAEYEFCWIGENGYRLDGRMTLADDAEGKLQGPEMASRLALGLCQT